MEARKQHRIRDWRKTDVRRASNRNVMAWTFMGNTRMHQVLREKGNKLSHVGIFTFEVSADGTISETGTAVSTILPYVKKWPHIKWLLTIMNHGTASIFTALRENTNGAQDTFLSEIVRIIDKYPWCSGIDIDLERGGELANRTKANALFSRIYSTVKAKGARAGEIDLIITKSISRFARNTVTVLKFARELKELGVGIFLKNRTLTLYQGTVR